MFEYYIERNKPYTEIQQPHKEQVQSQQMQWEHRQMMRQDYEGTFYRKLNYIVMMEECEQAYHQRQVLMISHREKNHNNESYSHRNSTLDIHPVTYLAKEMVKRNEKLRKQLQLKRKEAEVKVEMVKLELDKKCLLEEISIFANKLKEVIEEFYGEEVIKAAESKLLENGRKYNLLTAITSFVRSIKEITTHNIIYECLKSSIKRVNSERLSCFMKLDDLKVGYYQHKNKGELLDHINLYLKEFRSSTIYKELSEMMGQITKLYDEIDINSHYLYNKICEEIVANLRLLSKLNPRLEIMVNEIKDYKIDIEVIFEQIKNIQGEARQLQQKSAECIAQEASYLAKEYEHAKRCESDMSFSQEYEQTCDFFTYFHQQLKNKYQEFIKNQLEDAQHLFLLKQKIDEQAKILSQISKRIEEKQESVASELKTHRSLEESVYSQFNYNKQQQSNEKQAIMQILSSRQQFPKRVDSRAQSGHKTNAFVSRYQSVQQKYLVKRVLKIRNSAKTSGTSKENQKIFQVKLTKKYLILQQSNQNSLRMNEKVEIERIKQYNATDNEISFDCGVNTLKLQFISNNITSFMNKLERLFKELKMNKENYFSKK